MPTIAETPVYQKTFIRVKQIYDRDKGLTEQHHKDACDISRILGRARETGMIEHTNRYEGTYGNYLGLPDFVDAQRKIAEAKSMFMSLPAQVRAEFDNEPGAFVDFMTDESNRAKIREMGLSEAHLPPEANPDDLPGKGANPQPAPQADVDAAQAAKNDS